jgi:hypothetical protein
MPLHLLVFPSYCARQRSAQERYHFQHPGKIWIDIKSSLKPLVSHENVSLAQTKQKAQHRLGPARCRSQQQDGEPGVSTGLQFS